MQTLRVGQCHHLVALLALLVAACAPAAPGGNPGGAAAITPSAPSRTLRMAAGNEVGNLAAKVIGPSKPVNTHRMFNASHALIDASGTARPYLAESLPQLNSDSWRVFADGRMETTYKLRPKLTWHDGQPLTADDFVFGWRAYTAGIGIFHPKPQDLVEEITAPDPRTVVILWRSPYPGAGELDFDKLDPLPRHILEQPLAAAQQDPAAREAFLSLRFWTTEYVGAGPYRLERWDPGVEMEGIAFDGHPLGRPKIDRVIIRIIPDHNTVLTNILAGNVDHATGAELAFDQTLKRDWVAAGRGVLLKSPGWTIGSVTQLRPEFQRTPGLLDVRVRRAMAHTIDRQAINEGVFGGEGLPAETFVEPNIPYYDAALRAIVRHPYDARRAEQLMADAGFAKDREGLFASASGERFRPDFWVNPSPQWERQQAIMVSTWRQGGIDTSALVLSSVAARDNETRATFPGLSQATIEPSMEALTSSQIGSAANRWRGSNKGGYSNADVDRLSDGLNVTLDAGERVRQMIDILRIVSDELPVFALYVNFGVTAHVAELHTPEEGITTTAPHWNVHEWEWR